MKPLLSRQAFFLVCIMVLATWLRIMGLEWGLPDQRHRNSFVPDENSWIYILGQMKPQEGDFNPHYFSNPTLHFYLVGIGIQTAQRLGYLDILSKTSEKDVSLPADQYARLFLIGRYLSLIMSLSTVLLLYFIGRLMFGPLEGLLASFFLSIVPSHVIHSHFFSINVAVTFWLCVAFFFTLKLLETGGWRWYALAGITTGLAISTKYSAGPFVFIPVVAHFMANKRLLPLLGYLILAIISFFIGSPYILLAKREFVEGVSAVSRVGFGPAILSRLDVIAPGRVLLEGLGLPLLVAALLGAIYCLFKKRNSGILILMWIGTFFLITSLMPHYATDSRLLPLFPFLCLLGAGLSLGRKKGVAIFFIIIIVLGYNLPRVLALEKRFLGPSPQETASDWILENIPGGTKIGYETQPYWWAPYIHYSPSDRSLLKRYPLVICELDKNILAREQPLYFVATDYTFHRVVSENEDRRQYEDFCKYLQENYDVVEKFTKEFIFAKIFKVLIETRPDKKAVMDIYYQPIYILKRKEGGLVI